MIKLKKVIAFLIGGNMKIDIKKVKIIVTVPNENVQEVREAMCNEGAGIIGNYSYCSFSTKGIGTFKPSDKSNPYIGEKINWNL